MSEVTKGVKQQITKNFNTREVQCNCNYSSCKVTKFEQSHYDKLQILRDIIQRPITITSGYRCVPWNTKNGGSKTSNHLFGRATDIKTTLPIEVIGYYCKTIWADNGEMALYNNFVHIASRSVNQFKLLDYRTIKKPLRPMSDDEKPRPVDPPKPIEPKPEPPSECELTKKELEETKQQLQEAETFIEILKNKAEGAQNNTTSPVEKNSDLKRSIISIVQYSVGVGAIFILNYISKNLANFDLPPELVATIGITITKTIKTLKERNDKKKKEAQQGVEFVIKELEN